MSINPGYGQLSEAVLDFIPDEGNRERARTLLRLIFRAGSEARLDHGFAKLVNGDPLDRLAWLLRQDMLAEDVKTLVREAEDRREQDRAFTGTYGMTEADLRSMLAEGFHTAFRKAVDSPIAAVIHLLIGNMEPGEYGAIIDFVTEPVIDWLRSAEKQAAGETPR